MSESCFYHFTSSEGRFHVEKYRDSKGNGSTMEAGDYIVIMKCGKRWGVVRI